MKSSSANNQPSGNRKSSSGAPGSTVATTTPQHNSVVQKLHPYTCVPTRILLQPPWPPAPLQKGYHNRDPGTGNYSDDVQQYAGSSTAKNHHERPARKFSYPDCTSNALPPPAAAAASFLQHRQPVRIAPAPVPITFLPTQPVRGFQPSITSTGNSSSMMMMPSSSLPLLAWTATASFSSSFSSDRHHRSEQREHGKAPALRSGKWIPEEEAYAYLLVELFLRGTLDDGGGAATCEEGVTLRAYMARQLRCTPMRISKKFAGKGIGKVPYKRSTTTTMDATSKRQLIALERQFRVATTKFPPGTFAVSIDPQAPAVTPLASMPFLVATTTKTLTSAHPMPIMNHLAMQNSPVNTAPVAPAPVPVLHHDGSFAPLPPPNAVTAALPIMGAASMITPFSAAWDQSAIRTVTDQTNAFCRSLITAAAPPPASTKQTSLPGKTSTARKPAVPTTRLAATNPIVRGQEPNDARTAFSPSLEMCDAMIDAQSPPTITVTETSIQPILVGDSADLDRAAAMQQQQHHLGGEVFDDAVAASLTSDHFLSLPSHSFDDLHRLLAKENAPLDNDETALDNNPAHHTLSGYESDEPFHFDSALLSPKRSIVLDAAHEIVSDMTTDGSDSTEELRRP